MFNKSEIKKEILNEINKVNYTPLTLPMFYELFNINEEDYSIFQEVLNELLDNFDIFLSKKKDKYLSPRQAGKYKGIISIRNIDYGFVSNDFYPDFYVNAVDFNDSMDKDLVLYQVIDDLGYGKDSQAVVLQIIKRHYQYLVGEIYYSRGKYFLDCNEKSIKNPILVTNPQNIKLKAKDIVRVKIIKYDRVLKTEIIEVLGDNNTIGIDILQVLATYGIQKEFDQVVLDEVEKIENNILSEKKRRVDYTNKQVFTIDGDDAKDLDDAVSIELLDNGNYLLGVYIADVTYYVKENSLLDKAALSRGTSIYLTDRVIPMLPFRLSNDLCSLNPDEEKLVVSCIMEINSNGVVVDQVLEEGVIKSCKRLTYHKCNEVLGEGISLNPDYNEVYESLKLMFELAKILEDKRYKRGAITFDLDEAKIIVDENGKAIDIVKRERGISEKIIEEFMIVANETVAEYISNMDLPFIYRVHDKPDNVKFQTLKSMCKDLGYKVLGLYPKEIQKLLEKINDTDDYLKNTVLRLMAKAIYSEENIGHFGLASQCYTHFTSPIRRYPDEIVHRLIRKYIFEKDNEDMFLDKRNELNENIKSMAKLCSENERIANDIEFHVMDMKKAEYMSSFVGCQFDSTVASVLKFGIFVVLDNTVEGLISSRTLNKYNFYYDEITKTYINKTYIKSSTNGKRIRLGDKIKVKLIKTNKKYGVIDFDLVYNIDVGVKYYGKSKGYRKK